MTLGYEVVGKEDGTLRVTGSSSHGFTDPDLVPLRLKKHYPELYEKMAAAAK